MTIDQKVEAYRMRLEGYTLQEIADKFKCSRQYIQLELGNTGKASNVTRSSCIYPNIFSFQRKNNINIFEFSELTGFSQPSVSRYLKGKSDPPKKFIDAVLNATGMSYEEAFKKD